MPRKQKNKTISFSFFVDGFNSGARTIDEAFTLYEKLKYRWIEASFNLTKWRTNNEKLRDIIDVKEKVERKTERPSAKKRLGIKWDEYRDILIIDMKDFLTDQVNSPVTKRKVLSVIAGFHDHVGFIQPVVIMLKIFFPDDMQGRIRMG